MQEEIEVERCFKESMIKSHLTAQYASCLYIFRRLEQKSLTGYRPLCHFGSSPHTVGNHLEIRQYSCVISVQSDVVFPCRGGASEADRGADRQIKICALDLISVSLIFTNLNGH